jgi:hypothetical protein
MEEVPDVEVGEKRERQEHSPVQEHREKKHHKDKSQHKDKKEKKEKKDKKEKKEKKEKREKKDRDRSQERGGQKPERSHAEVADSEEPPPAVASADVAATDGPAADIACSLQVNSGESKEDGKGAGTPDHEEGEIPDPPAKERTDELLKR